MIMPKKHITLSESYIGLGAIILHILKVPMTVDDCWIKLQKDYIAKKKVSAKHSFDSIILTLDFLYGISSIDINDQGELYSVHT